ncbi:MAG: hypothetical protein HYY37_02815 [Candidatus Aenigmarchaeota archaeon]|nr:hypothetical protein [Candidatus Aenigmarchaeota archaeon]
MELFDLVKKGSSVLVIGKPRSEKTLFASQFLADGMRMKENSIYVITNNFPEYAVDNILRQMEGGIDTPLKIIDCYTLHAGISKLDESAVTRVSGPYALNEISIALTNVLRSVKPPVRVVFDTISPLVLHNKLSQIEEFMEVNMGKLKAQKSTTLIMVEKGMHDEKELSVLESLTDTTIEFGTGTLLIKHPAGEQEVKYKLEGNKILLES